MGDIVYTVAFDQPGAAGPGVTLNVIARSGAELEENYAAQVERTNAGVDELDDAYFLPWVEQKGADGKVQAKLTSCEEALVASAASGGSFTSLVAFDLDTLGAPARTLIASKAGFVYASAAAVYIATQGTDGSDVFFYGSNERSSIHKLALEGLTTRYVGTAWIGGHVLNQFSMDEQADVLRVATSSGTVRTPDVSSTVTTLSVQHGQFRVLGELTGLAPREDSGLMVFDVSLSTSIQERGRMPFVSGQESAAIASCSQ